MGEDQPGREYRKGNWTLGETVVLIAAKKLDNEQTKKGGDKESNRTAEVRWKWVENYCQRNGCYRNQNQCNDKWDNLLRDYKKVRDYEHGRQAQLASYWQLEKHERKEKMLPCNLPYQVYEALHGVLLDKRYPPRPTETSSSADKAISPPLQQHQEYKFYQQHQEYKFYHQHPPQSTIPPPQPISGGDSLDGESEIPQSAAKRRKVYKSSSTRHGLALASSKSTSELSQTLMVCEEKKDKRHKDLLGVEERKLQIEEKKREISREGIADLVGAVNNLANAVLALASDKNAIVTD